MIKYTFFLGVKNLVSKFCVKNTLDEDEGSGGWRIYFTHQRVVNRGRLDVVPRLRLGASSVGGSRRGPISWLELLCICG